MSLTLTSHLIRRLRFNQSLWITPTIVTVESDNSEADNDSLGLIPTTCVRHCVVSPELRQHGGKLTAMTTMSVKNNTASDMVISPGTRIGDINYVRSMQYDNIDLLKLQQQHVHT